MAGLTAAYRLAGGGHEVTVFETRDRLGGQASTFPIAGTDLEVFYHHLFTSDQAVLNLIDELGLRSKMQWLESKVGFFHGGTIYNFTTPADLLRFRALPPLQAPA
ncbi:MAG: FAD-dependent oxidoreductase, partial [Chloroflexi bacterium]|nr:FAD-dependent oxidoreductase [Chloroflexota bacterium]